MPRLAGGSADGHRAAAGGAVLTAVWQPILRASVRAGEHRRRHLAPIAGSTGGNPARNRSRRGGPTYSARAPSCGRPSRRTGKRVGLHVALFRGQAQDAKAITSTNQLVSAENKWWRSAETGTVRVDLGAGAQDVRTAVVADHRDGWRCGNGTGSTARHVERSMGQASPGTVGAPGPRRSGRLGDRLHAARARRKSARPCRRSRPTCAGDRCGIDAGGGQ